MFEDKPSLDARDLFLHLTALKALLETKKAQLAVLESRKEEGKPAEEETEVGEKPDEEETEQNEEGDVDEEEEAGEDEEKAVDEGNEDDSGAPVAVQALSTSTPSSVETPADSSNAASTSFTAEESDENELLPKEEQTVHEVAAEVDHLGVLLVFVEELFGPTCAALSPFRNCATDAESRRQSKLDRLLKEQQISFALLWALFPTDTIVEFIDDTSEQRSAFKLQTCSC